MTTPPPQRYRLIGLLAKPIGNGEQCAIKYGAIVAGQVDQTGLSN